MKPQKKQSVGILLSAYWINLIEKSADELLVEYTRVTGTPLALPIPVEDIAERVCALKLEHEIFCKKFKRLSAIVIPIQRRIIANKERSMGRIRFSIAHELAHWLIDGTIKAETTGLLDELANLRNLAPHEREDVVDQLAGAILMPRHILAQLHRQYNLDTPSGSSQIAQMLNVSHSALKRRIHQLQRKVIKKDEEITKKLPLKEVKATSGIGGHNRIVIIPPETNFDHRLIRMIRVKDKDERLYIGINEQTLQLIPIFCEFCAIDGFFFSDSQLWLKFQQENNHRTLWRDLTHYDQYYRRLIQGWGRQPEAEIQWMAYTRDDDDEVPEKLIDVSSLEKHIEPLERLNTRVEARQYIQRCKNRGQVIIIATGCFDLLTNGHIRFLQRAKKLGDILVVGIEDDHRVRKFKGTFRPVNTASQRLEVLNELQSVNFTFVIHGHTKQNVQDFYTRLHAQLKADILVVPDDDPHLNERREEIEEAGGRLEIINKTVEASTTSILKKCLSETILSDAAFVPKKTIYEWTKGTSMAQQLSLPLEAEPYESA
ncbi:MAG: adenylyltransferase/cytidyltransferase family protein [Chloroflexota bacterium]